MEIYKVFNPENYKHRCEECKEDRIGLYVLKIDGTLVVLCEHCCEKLKYLIGNRGMVRDAYYEVPAPKYKEPCCDCQQTELTEEEKEIYTSGIKIARQEFINRLK